MISPFYRWKSFWLGLFVLVFLGWAWIASRRDSVGIEWHRGGVIHTIASSGGQVEVRKWVGEPHYTLSHKPEGIVFGKLAVAGSPARDSGPKAFRSRWKSKWNWTFGVAHWFLMLLFLVQWSGWLTWRWRRLNRLQTEVSP